MEHLVIIGNGITGVTCARHVRKQSDMKITMVSSESEYFFSRTALMYVYMGHMKWENLKPYEDWFWGKNKIETIHAHVNLIDTDNKNITLDNGAKLSYDKLVVALPGLKQIYSAYLWLQYMECCKRNYPASELLQTEINAFRALIILRKNIY